MQRQPLASEGVADVFAALRNVLDPSIQRPGLASDVEVALFRSRWAGSHAVIHNPRTSAYLRISGAEADLIASLDGRRSIDDLMSADAASGLGRDEVSRLVSLLHHGGFLTAPFIHAYQLLDARTASRSGHLLGRAWGRMRTLTVPFPGAARVVDAFYDRGGRRVFALPAQVVFVAVIVSGGLAFVMEGRSGGFTLLGEPAASVAAGVILLGLVGLFLHEMGHALAVRHAGRRIQGAGFQLYAGHPAFFVDSSDMVMAGRRERAVNAAAGLYADAVLAGAAALGAAVVGPSLEGEVLFRFAGLTYVFLLINLVPLLELDGYWLLTDLLDVPDLRPRALAFLRRDLPERIRSRTWPSGREWGLALFGIFAAAASLVAIVLAWIVWFPVFRSFAAGLWNAGRAGQLSLSLLVFVVLCPVAHGASDGAAAVGRWARRQMRSLGFRAERGWRVEAGTMIAALPRAGELADEHLNDLAGRVLRRRFSVGETIAEQGAAAEALYLVRRGRCTLIEKSPNGSESVVAQLGPGTIFGELALLEGTAQVATLRGESPGEIFTLDAGTFQRVLASRLSPPLVIPEAWPLRRVSALAPFHALDRHATAELVADGTWVRVFPGEVLVADGELGEDVLVVERGQLQVERDSAVVRSLRAGEVYDKLAPVDAPSATANVRALTPGSLFVVSRGVFNRALGWSFQPDVDLHAVVRPATKPNLGP